MNKNYFVSGLTITLVIKMWISCSAKRRPKIKIRKRLEPKKEGKTSKPIEIKGSMSDQYTSWPRGPRLS